MMKPCIIFFGSDKYSQIVLKKLQEDKQFTITETISKSRPDIGIIASFGAIIPPDVIAIPKHGILNLHPSLLPKYRGSTPAPAAILAGKKETGLTIIKIDEKVDHGPIVAQFKELIKPDDTSETLLRRLFLRGADVFKTILPAYLKGKIELRQQEHSQATYTKKLAREDGKIDWQKPADYLERFIRAMSPWPGAWTIVKLKTQMSNGKTKRLKIIKAHLDDSRLIFDRVQLEGKKPVTWKQFCEGYPQAKLL